MPRHQKKLVLAFDPNRPKAIRVDRKQLEGTRDEVRARLALQTMRHIERAEEAPILTTFSQEAIETAMMEYAWHYCADESALALKAMQAEALSPGLIEHLIRFAQVIIDGSQGYGASEEGGA